MKKTVLLALAALMLVACEKAPVKYKLWYDWPERFLPDFSTLGEPDLQGTKSNIDLRGFDDKKNHFCILFEAPFKVRTEEEYLFTLTTDDGSRFYIDGELLIVNDGAHGPIEKKVSKVLSKGKHDLRIEFFDYDKLQTLIFKYSTPTIEEREYDDQVMAKEDRLTNNKSFVKPQVKEAYKRFLAWKGDDETVVFPIITDVHTGARFSYKHVGYAAEAGRRFKADFMANLGDIGLNTYPATVDSVYAQFILDKTLEGMRKYDGIWLYCPGNHDWDGGQGKWLTEEYLSDFFQKPWEDAAAGNLHRVPGRTYGYLDIPAKNFRVIYLNSESTRTKGDYYYTYGDEQLEWLASLLDATPEDMHVLLLSHWMPHSLGTWNAVSMNPIRKEASSRIMDLLASYEGKINLVGLFTGDTHVNFVANVKGVNYFVSQGYGWNAPDMLLPGQDYAFFDYAKSLCIDVVAVKPATREVHTFRIGAGGADFDYEFDYPGTSGADPAQKEAACIWDHDYSAFPSIVRYRGVWYVSFREGVSHIFDENGIAAGKTRILQSTDCRHWKSVALLEKEGYDLRDPKLSVTPDGRLMVIQGGSVYEDKKLVRRVPQVSFSSDGRTFSDPQPVDYPIPGGFAWFWRVTWHVGTGYTVNYGEADDNCLELLKTTDGVHFEKITDIALGGFPNESTVRFLPDGRMVMLIRREKEDKMAYIGISKAPYTDWQLKPLPFRIGGPEMAVLPDGTLLIGGRAYFEDGEPRTCLWRGTVGGDFEFWKTLPSGGDNSYPGFLIEGDELTVVYYSSHELVKPDGSPRAGIYLARMPL